MVVNVWPFLEANSRAWEVLTRGGSALDAVVEGCNVCEVLQCDGSDLPLRPISSLFHRSIPPITKFPTLCLHRHFPFSPPIFSPSHSLAPPQPLPFLPLLPIANASMSDSMDVGAVAGLRRVKAAVRAAYLVLLHTYHSLLIGDAATDFALEMGLAGPEDLSTNRSLAMWRQWKAASCQPNYWRNVTPDAARYCGPYRPATAPGSHASEPSGGATAEPQGAEAGAGPGGAGPAAGPGDVRVGCDPRLVGREQGLLRRRNRLASHDTISMVAIAQNGSMAAATSTNGLTFHIPGRVGDAPIAGAGAYVDSRVGGCGATGLVGDAPIAGAGAYVDSRVGGCGATGDGDVMMRFLPCFLAVELMRMGSTPASAAEAAISRIRAKFPTFQGGLVAVNRFGEHGAAVNNWVLQYTTEVANLGVEPTADDKPTVGTEYEAREVREEEIGADREGEVSVKASKEKQGRTEEVGGKRRGRRAGNAKARSEGSGSKSGEGEASEEEEEAVAVIAQVLMKKYGPQIVKEEDEGLGNGRSGGWEEIEGGEASDAATVAAVAAVAAAAAVEEEVGMDTEMQDEEVEAEASEEGIPSMPSRPRATSRSSLLSLYRFFSSHLGISSPSTIASLLASNPQLLRSNPTNDLVVD
ncbi:unnamed protein product [Closterium sp. Naga37s-1]|nr:unnamed protein product [Closterium sp. Naga37s-1]